MGSHPVILNGKGAAAVMVAAWASWVPAVSVVCVDYEAEEEKSDYNEEGSPPMNQSPLARSQR